MKKNCDNDDGEEDNYDNTYNIDDSCEKYKSISYTLGKVGCINYKTMV